MRLNDKYAVITGGAGGIGLASARRFLDEGVAGVMLVDLDEEALKEAASSLDTDRVEWRSADAGNSEAVRDHTDAAIERFGRIDVLFLNAGIEGVVKPPDEYPEDMYDKVLNVNVKGSSSACAMPFRT